MCVDICLYAYFLFMHMLRITQSNYIISSMLLYQNDLSNIMPLLDRPTSCVKFDSQLPLLEKNGLEDSSNLRDTEVSPIWSGCAPAVSLTASLQKREYYQLLLATRISIPSFTKQRTGILTS